MITNIISFWYINWEVVTFKVLVLGTVLSGLFLQAIRSDALDTLGTTFPVTCRTTLPRRNDFVLGNAFFELFSGIAAILKSWPSYISGNTAKKYSDIEYLNTPLQHWETLKSHKMLQCLRWQNLRCKSTLGTINRLFSHVQHPMNITANGALFGLEVNCERHSGLARIKRAYNIKSFAMADPGFLKGGGENGWLT